MDYDQKSKQHKDEKWRIVMKEKVVSTKKNNT